MIKKTLKWIGLVVAGLVLIGLAMLWVSNEIRPQGVPGEAADMLAKKMESSLNGDAWDATGAVSFDFMGNQHLWDRKRQFSRINWKEYEALVDLTSREGIVFKDGKEVKGNAGTELINEAWKKWVNDAFWLSAPFKAFDTGVSRELVIDESGDSTLMVQYLSGGSTPGDTYLWKLDKTGKPISWKMWVSIIPVGGIEIPYDGWTATETGAILPTGHSGLVRITIKDVKTTEDLSEWYPEDDPFEMLVNQ